MNVPAFTDISEEEQASDLKAYLGKLGADIKSSKGEEGAKDLYEDLAEIVEKSDLLWKADKEAETEAAFNSILTLLFMIPPENAEGLVQTICNKLTCVKLPDKSVAVRLRLLQNFMFGLVEVNPLCYTVFCSLVKLAGDTDNIHNINTSLEKMQTYCKDWQCDMEKVKALYRLLHDALVKCKKPEEASKIIVALLSMYTEENASQAREDAHKCILACIADPDCLLFDHLLPLKPVQFLEGEPIHKLLTIYVSGTLQDYLDFCNKHQTFINSSGLSHENNLKKIRVLTFMSLCESRKEIEFDMIQEKMQIAKDDVQQFIIDVLSSNKVNGRMHQVQQKVVINYAMPRRFGKQQWIQLRDRLTNWRARLILMQRNLDNVVGLTAAAGGPGGPGGVKAKH